MNSTLNSKRNYFNHAGTRQNLNIKLVLLLLIIMIDFNFAQPWDTRFEFYGYEHGLRQYPTTIFQDGQGFIWLGATNGIYRFDGIHFKWFSYAGSSTEPIEERVTNCIQEDSDGQFIIGTNRGLIRLNPFSGHVEKYIVPITGIDSMQINCLYLDSRSNLWVGTMQDGLIMVDRRSRSKVVHHYSTADSTLCSNIVHAVIEWKDHIWIGTEQGMTIIDPVDNTHRQFRYRINDDYGLPNNSVRVLYKKENGDLWLGLNDGYIVQMDHCSGDTLALKTWQMDNLDQVTGIWQQDSERIWIGTFHSGLNRLNTKTGHIQKLPSDYEKKGYLKDDDVYYILASKDEILWVLTRWGLNKYDSHDSAFKYYPIEGPADLWIFAITAFSEADDGSLWIGTWGRGLFRLPSIEKDLVNYYPNINPDSFGSRWVTSLLTDIDGRIWAGTEQGLELYNPVTDKFQTFNMGNRVEKLASNYVFCLMQDRSGNLWIATSGGLSRRDRGRSVFTHFLSDSDKALADMGYYIGALLEDEQGRIWIGGKGLHRFDPVTKTMQSLTFYLQSNQLLNQTMIFSLLQDKRKNIWVASYDGLFRLGADSSVTHFTTSDGLPSDIVYRILEDNNGNLWITTFKGLVKFDPIQQRFETFTLTGTFLENEFGVYGAYKSGEGKLFLGQAGRFSYFDPQQLEKNDRPPEIVLTGISLFDKPLHFEKPLSAIQEIECNYLQTMFTFQYSCFNYTRSEQNRFRYRLDGLNRDWIDGENRQQVTYSNLQPGQYTFRVKAANSDGVWSKHEATITLIIAPPWWKLWWVRSLVMLIVFILFGSFYKRRTAYLKRQANARKQYSEQLIRAQEEERRRIGSELHDGHGQNLLIANNEIQQFVENHPRIGQELTPALDTIQESIKEVRSISSELHPHVLDRLGLQQAIESMVQKLEAATDIRFEMKFAKGLNRIDKKSRLQVFRIIQESLNNIVKHARASKVKILISLKETKWYVEILDDGRGFDVQKSIRSGAGFGLSDMRQRAEMMGARISITSSGDQGTRIDLQFESRT